ncbi:MAG TPA: 50S ribosomal protein L17 [Verrucomicrobiae bacterium]|jgi:large subunit ribosomal protein L17|nr:50S ribosomal protein L17 [Verrucomicrobiae bacterium]
MRHRKLRRKLGRKNEHRVALLRNLVRALVAHKKIHTTLIKAKEASAFSDNMIELAKRGDLHARRLLVSRLRCVETTDLLIKTIAPAFKDRKGGYTRVLKLGNRPGDGAPKAILEFTVPFEVPVKEPKKKKPKKEEHPKAAEAEAPAKKAKGKEKAKPEPKSKAKEHAEEAKPEKKGEAETPDKKEGDKKGGFLGTLRKFLKGDE